MLSDSGWTAPAVGAAAVSNRSPAAYFGNVGLAESTACQRLGAPVTPSQRIDRSGDRSGVSLR